MSRTLTRFVRFLLWLRMNLWFDSHELRGWVPWLNARDQGLSPRRYSGNINCRKCGRTHWIGDSCEANNVRSTVKPLVRLWLDDIRDPAHHGCIGWTWAKTAQEAIAILATGRVVEASLDHDLTINQTLGMPDKEDTGYTVVCWMEEHGVWPLDGVRCHSMNPVGRQRIEAVIRKANASVCGYPPGASTQDSFVGGTIEEKQ